MVRYVRRCSVRGCTPLDLKRFSFPRTVEWAEKWRKACANPKLKEIAVEKLHTRFVVCRKHFAKHQFVNHLMEKLNHKVVPILFLPLEDSLEGTLDIPPDSEDASGPLQPPVVQDVILPQMEIVSTHDSVEFSDTATCSDNSNTGKDVFSKDAPSVSSSVLPCTQVLSMDKESEICDLESTTTKMVVAPLNDYYRYTLCRLCFCSSDSLINIFEEGHECGFVISDAIKDLLQFKVSKADDYPQFICSSCLIKLGEFKEFKDVLCKQKEIFEEALHKLRSSPCKEGTVKVEVEHEAPVDEDLESSNWAGVVKQLSEMEETDKEDFVANYSECSSESEENISGIGESAMEELVEPETKMNIHSEVREIVLQGEYKCHECGEVFKFVNLLTKHKKAHQKTWPLPCQYCEKRFKTLIDLNNHIVMHSDYKPYQCEHCGMRCRTKSTLARHKQVHSDDKPFLCSTCGMSFRERIFLRDHLRMHSDIKCYKCEECGKEFRTGSKLTNHYVSHMKESPYICGECGKSFRKGKSLKWHLQCVHSDEKHFQCGLCNKSFSIRKYLNSHMKIHLKNSM